MGANGSGVDLTAGWNWLVTDHQGLNLRFLTECKARDEAWRLWLESKKSRRFFVYKCTYVSHG